MPQDAPPNGSAPGPAPEGPWSRVAGMQAKLHRWAARIRCRALPGSEYYGGSAPPQAGRPTAGPARIRALAARDRAGRDGSRVHCDSLDEGGAQLCPCGIATATPQTFTVASRQTSTCPSRSSPSP